MADSIGVTVQAVCFWRDGKRSLPPEHCPTIEREGGFVVRRWHMRPDDWHKIWPELIGAAGAPDAPRQEPGRAAA